MTSRPHKSLSHNLHGRDIYIQDPQVGDPQVGGVLIQHNREQCVKMYFAQQCIEVTQRCSKPEDEDKTTLCENKTTL
jgi:hypothetical protein